jgi:endoglucanase
VDGRLDEGAKSDLQAGRIPLVNWEPAGIDFNSIVNGSLDATINARANGAKALNGRFFLDFAAEMNGDEAWSGNNAPLYVAAYKHIHDLFTAAGATNVIWAWCPNVTDTNGTNKTTMDYYPGDAYVDWTGVDGYNWGGGDWQSFRQCSRTSIRCWPPKQAHPSSARWRLPSREATRRLDRRHDPDAEGPISLFKAVVWFDINKENDWRVNSSPAALTAFSKMAKDRTSTPDPRRRPCRFRRKNFGRLPPTRGMAIIARTNAGPPRSSAAARGRGGARGRDGRRVCGDAELEGAHLAGHVRRHGRRVPGQSEQRHDRCKRLPPLQDHQQRRHLDRVRDVHDGQARLRHVPVADRRPIDTFDKNVVLGLFPYGPAAGIGSDGTNEIDIEYSRWGQANGPNGDWTDYPASGKTIGELAYTFTLGGGTLSTSRFRWTTTSIANFLLGGLQPIDETTGLIKSWTYAPSNPTTNIPQQALPLGMNLWCFESPPTDGKPVEIVIRDFQFVPEGAGGGAGAGGAGGGGAGGRVVVGARGRRARR